MRTAHAFPSTAAGRVGFRGLLDLTGDHCPSVVHRIPKAGTRYCSILQTPESRTWELGKICFLSYSS